MVRLFLLSLQPLERKPIASTRIIAHFNSRRHPMWCSYQPHVGQQMQGGRKSLLDQVKWNQTLMCEHHSGELHWVEVGNWLEAMIETFISPSPRKEKLPSLSVAQSNENKANSSTRILSGIGINSITLHYKLRVMRERCVPRGRKYILVLRMEIVLREKATANSTSKIVVKTEV